MVLQLIYMPLYEVQRDFLNYFPTPKEGISTISNSSLRSNLKVFAPSAGTKGVPSRRKMDPRGFQELSFFVFIFGVDF